MKSEATTRSRGTGAYLDEATLTDASFEGADLSEAKLVGVSAAGASFARAHLLDADFSHANLANASFDGAHVSGTDFVNSDLMNASFDGATGFETMDLTDAVNVEAGVRLRWCAFNSAHFCP